MVVALRGREVGLGELPGADLARSEPGGHLVRVESGRLVIGAEHAPPRMAGHDDELALALGGVAEDGLDRQRLAGDVVAEDVLELDRLGGRRDVVGVQPGEDRVLVEDVVELALETASSSSVSPRRARYATCSTSDRDRVATAR